MGKLIGRGFAQSVVDEAAASLERVGLIDDADFAARFIQDRMRLRPSGHAALRRDLRRRGVEPDLIEAALEEAFKDVDLEAVAFRLLCGRRSRYLHVERAKALNRMYGFLGRRGFPSDVARSAAFRALDEMSGDTTNLD